MLKYLVLFMLMMGQLAWAAPREIDDYHWTGVERVVAIGDIHGDYQHYMATLRAAGLVNSKGRWTGGKTHLVQVGDIPDRGPDTLRIIEHIQKLAKEAARHGGMVHSLIGNHEAMNVYGDLSYTTPGEFAAFADRNSARLRDRYFNLVLQNMQKNFPETFATLPENYRELWDKDHPLGWLEHRQAWSQAWNPNAELADWVTHRKVAIQINDMIFLHGGISGFYCQNSLQSLTEKVVNGLRNFDPKNPGILQDDFGPLWYRGLAGMKPVAAPQTVQATLEQHQARYIVIGHTPTGGAIWPRYGGSVIQIDTGISAFYGGHVAYLEVTPEGMFAGYPGGKIKLPSDKSGLIPYLEKVIALEPGNPHLQRQLERLKNPPPVIEESAAVKEKEAGVETAKDTTTEGTAAAAAAGTSNAAEPALPAPVTVPICGISE